MGIKDAADRLKILQQITSMRADLVTSGAASPTKRSTLRRRQFADSRVPSQQSGGGRITSQEGWSPRDGGNMYPGMERNKKSVAKYVNISIQERNSERTTSITDFPSCISVDQISSDSRDSSRMSSPDKLHYIESYRGPLDVGGDSGSDVSCLSKFHTMAALGYHFQVRA